MLKPIFGRSKLVFLIEEDGRKLALHLHKENNVITKHLVYSDKLTGDYIRKVR